MAPNYYYTDITADATGSDATYYTGTSAATPMQDIVYYTNKMMDELDIKQKLNVRRFYIYSIDKRNKVVISARSVSEANHIRDTLGIARHPEYESAEHTAKRLRTRFEGHKGKMMDSAYGVFLLKDITRNMRKIILT